MSDKTIHTMTVASVEDQGDRLVLFAMEHIVTRRYYVVARPDAAVQFGDVVQYEPCDKHCGFMVEGESDPR